MPELQYRLHLSGGLCHWEVLTQDGTRLRGGASDSSAKARAEAMAACMHPAMHVEIDTIELKRSADRLEMSHRVFADAQKRRAWLDQDLSDLVHLEILSTDMVTKSRDVLAASWRLLRELGDVRASDPPQPPARERPNIQ